MPFVDEATSELNVPAEHAPGSIRICETAPKSYSWYFRDVPA